MKKLWTPLYVLGMLLALGLIVRQFASAMLGYPMYVGVAALLLIGWIIAIQPRVRKERERTRKLVNEAFRGAYAQLANPPSIVITSSYGYPAFEIKFRSKAEMEGAAAPNDF